MVLVSLLHYVVYMPNKFETGNLLPSPEEFENKSLRIEQTMSEPFITDMPHGRLICGTDAGVNYASENEDGIVVNRGKDAFAVIDSLGKYGRGIEATDILASEFQSAFELDETFEKVNRNTYARMNADGLEKNGSCYIAVQFKKDDIEIAQQGDVRLIVILSEGLIDFETDDENLPPPNTNTVTNAVSGNSPGNIKRDVISTIPGSRIVIGSDGIWKNISPEKFIEITQGKTLEEAMKTVEEYIAKKMSDKASGGQPDHRSLLIYEITK